MYYIRQTVILILIILVGGCGISRRVGELQEVAGNAFESGNYSEALNYYEEIIELKTSRDKDVDGETYYHAGISAWETGQSQKTINYLELARKNDFLNEKSRFILSLAYKKIDNLSLEINYLESYAENHPDGDYIDIVKPRLFETYIESNNFDEALELWNEIEEIAEEDPDLLDSYFSLKKQLGHTDELEDIAKHLMEKDPDNKNALEYLGDLYFWKAENLYQREMEAYEQNQTRRQYRLLLKALDQVNEWFKISRNYFERLYEIDPRPKYAEYLRNIYMRFGNDEKAGFYDKKAKEKE